MQGDQLPLVLCGCTSCQRASWRAAWEKRDDAASVEGPPHEASSSHLLTPAHTKLHFNDLEMKILSEPIFDQIQITARFRYRNSLLAHSSRSSSNTLPSKFFPDIPPVVH